VITNVMAILLLSGLFPGLTVRGLERVTDVQEARQPVAEASLTTHSERSLSIQPEPRIGPEWLVTEP